MECHVNVPMHVPQHRPNNLQYKQDRVQWSQRIDSNDIGWVISVLQTRLASNTLLSELCVYHVLVVAVIL